APRARRRRSVAAVARLRRHAPVAASRTGLKPGLGIWCLRFDVWELVLAIWRSHALLRFLRQSPWPDAARRERRGVDRRLLRRPEVPRGDRAGMARGSAPRTAA